MPSEESSGEAQAPKGGRNIPAAIGVGVLLLGALAVGLLWAPWFFIFLAAAALALGVIEVHQALLRKGFQAQVACIVVGTVVSVLGGYVTARMDVGLPPAAFAVICVAGTFLACLIALLFRRNPEGFIRDVAASALIITYIPLMGIFVPLLMAAPHGNRRFVVVIFCIVAADTGAYVVGSLCGRHKMAPTISPSKTWEGFAGSMVAAGLVGAVAAVWGLGAPWWLGLLLGLCISPAATLGDLVESQIKRDVGIKDMSNFLPGHGGVMDRLDSMLVAVPVGWLVLHLSLGG